MKLYEFGNEHAECVLIQPVDDHDSHFAEKIFAGIRQNIGRDIRMLFLKVDDWNLDLSPWKAPAVFGSEDFKGGAPATLKTVKELCTDRGKRYYLGGYSLAALFALWAAYECKDFAGIAAASPSIWFPGFADYMQTHQPGSPVVYLSLGDREEKTSHPILRTAGDNIRAAYELLKQQNVSTMLEWNKGNHFKDPEKRVISAFTKVLELSGPE